METEGVFTICIFVQVVNKILKLGKTAELEPIDPVDVYYKFSGNEKKTREEIKSHVSYNRLINIQLLFWNIFFTKTTLFCTGSVYYRHTWFGNCFEGNGTNGCGKFRSSILLDLQIQLEYCILFNHLHPRYVQLFISICFWL